MHILYRGKRWMTANKLRTYTPAKNEQKPLSDKYAHTNTARPLIFLQSTMPCQLFIRDHVKLEVPWKIWHDIIGVLCSFLRKSHDEQRSSGVVQSAVSSCSGAFVVFITVIFAPSAYSNYQIR